jgi:type I restriction enzyme S subunit
MNYPKKRLSDMIIFSNGKSIKPGGEGEFPVYGSNGIIGYGDQPREKNGAIIGRVGAYCGSVAYCPDRFWASDNTIVAYPKTDGYDVRFIYYLLKDLNLNRWAGGAAQPLLTQTVLNQIEAVSPLTPIQRKISTILSAYDDLIENNLRRIKILEEMTQTLYREWFVKFRFPGHQNVKMVDSPMGKIPEGWEIKNLFELADVTYGFPFKSSLFNVNREGTPVVRIRDVLDGQSATFTTEDAPDKYIVHDGDFLVGMDGDFHMGFWASGTAFLVQRVARFRPRGDVGRYGLALALKEPIEHFNKTITGTTVAHLGDNHLRTINMMMPDKRLLKVINDILEPLLDFQLNIRAKNKNLRQTRDLLLPKLISGELDVSELNITIPEAKA